MSKDSKTWTFFLRKGVTFHDGTAFNADAVKYSIDATIKLGQGYAYLWGDLKSIKVTGAYTVQFVWKAPTPLLNIASSQYGAWIFSPKTASWTTDYWNQGHEDGTGPYTLTTYSPQQQIVLTAYDNYWGGWNANQYKTINNEVISAPTTAQEELTSGQIDILGAGEVQYDQVSALKANPNLQVKTSGSLISEIVYLNTLKKPLEQREGTPGALVRDAVWQHRRRLPERLRQGVGRLHPQGTVPARQRRSSRIPTTLPRPRRCSRQPGIPRASR